IDRSNESAKTAVGNVRVRTRAVCNYFVANRQDRIVLGTGNRTEALVGYFTKFGDGAVDCNPIGNRYKVQVRQLASALGVPGDGGVDGNPVGHLYQGQVRQLARELGVPDDLVDTPPTAGMWVGQTDEGELGMGYDLLDAVLALHIDGPLSAAATARELGIDEERVEDVETLVVRSAHKRTMPPAPDPLDQW